MTRVGCALVLALTTASSMSACASAGDAVAHSVAQTMPPFPVQGDPCGSFLMQTRAMLMTILHDLPLEYGAVAGTIHSITEIRSDVYEVAILHEERTDVLTFEASVTPGCKVTISRIGGRVASSRPPISPP